MKEKYLSIGKAARYLGISIKTLRRWEKEGKIGSARLDGKNRFFKVKELKRLKEDSLNLADAADITRTQKFLRFFSTILTSLFVGAIFAFLGIGTWFVVDAKSAAEFFEFRIEDSEDELTDQDSSSAFVTSSDEPEKNGGIFGAVAALLRGPAETTVRTLQAIYPEPVNNIILDSEGIIFTESTGDTSVTELIGPAGPAGPQGEQGLPGEAGASGQAGAPGQAGEQGAQGITGQQGEQGAPGPDGAPGSDGADAVFHIADDSMVGIGVDVPSTALHVDSNGDNSEAILTLENTAGDMQFYRVDANPESNITGSVGDIAIDSTNGKLYIKGSGNATNTGWTELGASTGVLADGDSDTRVAVEQGTDDDTIRFDLGGTTPINNALTINQTNGFVWNDANNNLDFRLAGETDDNLFYLDASANAVGIGTNTPDSKLDVVGDVTIGTSSVPLFWADPDNSSIEVAGGFYDRGIVWEAQSAAGNDDGWRAVTYGNGRFVTVGQIGDRVKTSPDGINWTTSSSAGNNDAWLGITYGNGLFVAISGSGDRVKTSPDGINWTARDAAGNDDSWRAVTYGNGLFVAVSRGGDLVMTSPDGINWTVRSAADDNDQWRAVTYGNGLFVAVGNNGDRVITSPDGINWTARSAAGDNDSWFGLTYGNGLFVAVGDSGDRVMTSPDGITWTARSAAGDDDDWGSVTYGGGLFVAVGDLGDRVMTSPDGITWTARSAAGNDDDWRSITYGNGRFVAVGNGPDRVMTSGQLEETRLAHNNIYQGGMSIFGNVGIGTTTPSAALSVDGNLEVTEGAAISIPTTANTNALVINSSIAPLATLPSRHPLLIESESEGAIGPYMALFHNSASPAADDQLGGIGVFGRNSLAEEVNYGGFGVDLLDPTDNSEDSRLSFYAYQGGSQRNVLIINNGFNGITVGGSSADAIIESSGNHNLILRTGNSTTGNITLTDGANGDINIVPNGTGGVGVGTTNPSALLHVVGLHSDTGFKWESGDHDIEFGTPGGYTGLVFNANRSGNYSRFDIVNQPAATTADRYLSLGYNGDNLETLVITTDGEVGIGTSTPDARLDVVSSSTSTTAATTEGLEFTVSDTGVVTTGTDTLTGLDFNITRTGATGGTINTIGLDLDVVGSTGGTSTLTGLDVNVSGADTNYAAVFNGGDVGIGTSSPEALLDVGTEDTLRLLLDPDMVDQQDSFGLGFNSSMRRFTLHSSQGTFNQVLEFGDSDGPTDTIFGIGMSNNGGTTWEPNFVVKQDGNVAVGTSTPDGQFQVMQSGTEDIFNLYDNTVNVLTVLDGGNVGIGTSSPAGNLTVQSFGTQPAFVLENSSGTRTVEALADGAFSLKQTGSDKIGRFDDGGTAYGIAVSGGLAYVADGSDGLEIVDVRDLGSLQQVGQFDDGGTAYGVVIVGSYAYVADFTDGLEIVDISDPTAPTQAGQFDDGGIAYGVAVAGDYAYLADGTDGLEIVDISDPTAPTQVGQFDDGGTAYSVAVVGNYAYLADDTDGLEIVDISDPTAPTQVGQVYDGGNARGVVVVGTYAYVADGTNGLEIIDISDPASPSEVGQFTDGGVSDASGLVVAGDYAYVADLDDGLEIVDIGDPTNPDEVGAFNDGGRGRGVTIAGNYLYVADGLDGVEIFSLANLTTPTAEIGSLLANTIQASHLHISQLLSTDTALNVGTDALIGESLTVGGDARVSGNVSLTADSTTLSIGAGSDLQFTHNGTNSVLTSATGNLLIDNTNTTGATQLQLGTDTNATGFQILNNTGNMLFEVNGAGTATLAGDLLPSVDDTHSLGSATLRWEEVWVGPGTIHIGDSSNSGRFGYNTTGNYFEFDPDGDSTPELVLTDAGRLGIGTTSPESLLDVMGAAQFGSLTMVSDTLVDADGSTTTDVGTANTIAEGAALTPVEAADNLCTNSLTAPTIVFILTGETTACNTTDGTTTNLLGTAVASTQYTVVGSTWAFQDTVTANSTYTNGEDLYIDTVANLAYDSGGIGIGTSSPDARLAIDGQLEVRQTASADIFNLYDNTTNVLTVLDGGNVGIGQTNPGTALEIGDGTDSTGVLTINRDLNPSILFEVDSVIQARIQGKDGLFQVANIAGTTARLVVDTTTGDVGIGTSTPDSLNARAPVLQITSGATTLPGIVLASGDSSYPDNWEMMLAAGTSPDLGANFTIRQGTTDRFFIEHDSGDIGIGDSTPDGQLEVRQTDADDIFNLYDGTTNVFTVLDGGDVGIGDSTPDGQLEVRQTASADIFNLYDNTTNVLTVLDGGNVGIGQTSPGTDLEIGDGTDTTGVLTINRNSNPSIIFEEASVAQGRIAGRNGNFEVTAVNGGTTHFAVDSTTGFVGIGDSTPTEGHLVVRASDDPHFTMINSGTADMGFIRNDSAAVMYTTGADAIRNLTFSSGNSSSTLTEHMRITSDGDLTIGNSTADGTLRVTQDGTADIFNLYDDTANVFTVVDGGEVGIGTTNPLELLHVDGHGSFGDSVTDTNSTRALNLISSDAVMRILRVSADIDTAAPAIELMHRTTADGTDTAYWDLFLDSGGLHIRDRNSSNAVRMNIDASGDVGIGDETPDARLDVVSSSTSTTAATTEGLEFTVSDTGVVTTGTDTLTGLDFNITRTGATGGTINTIGLDLDVTGDSGGTSTLTGLDVNVSGADTNYAASFRGGNVGIGTATPSAPLHVVGSNSGNGIKWEDGDHEVEFSTPGGETGLIFNANQGGNYSRFDVINHQAAATADRYFALGFNHGGTGSDTLAITYNQQVGIGTVTPDALLDVVSSSTDTTAATTEGLEFNVSDTGIVTTGTDTLTGLDFNITRTGATGGTINTIGLDLDVTGDSGGTSTLTGLDVNVSGADTNYAASFRGGNVGIGTATPSASLHVVGAGGVKWEDGDHDVEFSTPGGHTGLIFNTNNSGNYSRFDVVNHQAAATADRYFALGFNHGVTGSDTLAITYDEQVGIGTVTPDARLDVVSSSTDTTAATTEGLEFNVSDTGIVTTGTDTLTGLDFNITRTGATGGTINTIGLDLDVVGSTGGTSTLTGLDVNVSGADTNYAALFDGGNVGINTASPQSLLDVQGDAGSAGILTLASKELTVVDGDVLGQINFNAPLESDGTNAILVGASIWAESNTTFSTTTNATELVFATSNSQNAVERMRIHSAGTIQFSAYGSGTLQTDANGNITAGTSDERLKHIQGSFARGLEDLLKLDPISYKWNEASGLETEGIYTGFSAQNVQGAIPEAVGTSSDGYLTLSDRAVLAAAINAIKELDANIADQALGTAGLIEGVNLDLVAESQNTSELLEAMGVTDTGLRGSILGLTERVAALEIGDIVATGDTSTSVANSSDSEENSGATEAGVEYQSFAALLEEGEVLSYLDEEETLQYAGLGVAEKANYRMWQVVDRVVFTARTSFQGVVDFFGDVTFGSRVTFEDKDLAGMAIVQKDKQSVAITFEREYEFKPIVTATRASETATDYIATNVTTKGFEIRLNQKALEQTIFSWQALLVKDPNVFGSDVDVNDPLFGRSFIDPLSHEQCNGYAWVRGFNPEHTGVDLSIENGCPIQAIAPGKVTNAGWLDDRSGYGVEIDHYDGVTSYVIHGEQDSILVNVGDLVNSGQDLMRMGSTGESTGTHLHLGLVVDGVFVDPQGIVPYNSSLADNQLAEPLENVDSSEEEQISDQDTTEQDNFSEIRILSSEFGYVNVRSQPSISADKIGEVVSENIYIYDQIDSGWYRVNFVDGSWGWVSGVYVEEI